MTSENNTAGLRVLVCGGRNYRDGAKVWGRLNILHAERGIGAIIHGAQRGADQLGEYWAKANDIRHIPFKPHWDTDEQVLALKHLLPHEGAKALGMKSAAGFKKRLAKALENAAKGSGDD